ncbi:peptidoglycan-recognition protein 1-like isoform X2 [Macrosteles quadrilineatus]|uniref:peptidoglycan-recognition protein 1-like isoform X2 n=1 Tax=Macrosteles quadrilineatus TaxID=74068 RepID=UPI0023E18FC9|nr:peptidoglycan-recognition protein 1-like isoform X2 [Macrosteles quadrilineatus]
MTYKPAYPHDEIEFDPSLDLKPFEQEVVKRTKPVIVPRSQWGALPAKQTVPTKLPLRRVFLTLWTDTPPCTSPEECERTMRELQRRHMDEFGLSDIKWNFLIGGDKEATIYEGRGWYNKSSKVLEMNPHHYLERLDIAFIGDYRNAYPPPLMVYNMDALLAEGERTYLLHELFEDYTWLNGDGT